MNSIKPTQIVDLTQAGRLHPQKISTALPKGEKLRLTEAIVSMDPLNRPLTEGYKTDIYHDKETGESIPALDIATHSDKLIDVFLDLVDLMYGKLGLILETSHNYPDGNGKHDDLFRADVEPWYIKHIVCQHSDLFLNDGCTGIAIMNFELPEEIQFDEHNCLFVYTRRIEEFKRVLEDHGINYDKELHLISDGEHKHVLSEEYSEQFQELACEAGVSEDPGEDEELFDS